MNTMRESRLFSNLTDKEYETIVDVINPRLIKLSAKEVLFDEYDEVNYYWIVKKGKLQSARIQYDGTYQLNYLYSHGGIIGIDIANTKTRISPFHVSVTDDAELYEIPRTIISNKDIPNELREKINANVIRVLSNSLIKRQFKIDILHKKSVRTRISLFLKFMSDKRGSNVFDIDIDREQFAQYLGVNRSVLSHELSRMRSEGIINFHKGHFEILEMGVIKTESEE